ncbi:MAG TPA: TIGR00282 family metallophosphoesterase [Trueperaceae bacterium]|nr:TIGR00282 family metallophosphoesterase [Trueperaceae bacterium]
MRVLFVGDVFATPGMTAATAFVKERRDEFDLVVVNGENAAGGFGITRRHFEQLVEAGADVVTLGNHAFDQPDALALLEETPRLLRPANLPVGTPGVGSHVYQTRGGERVAVVQLMGRIFMEPLDDPFRVVDEALERVPSGVPVVVDFHAEATSEKKVMLYHLAGRVAALVGTHTHVQTADETVHKGTAYITDVGMTGVQGSSIGMRYEDVFHRLVAKLPRRYRPAEGPATVCALAVDLEGTRATRVERLWVPQERRAAVEGEA